MPRTLRYDITITKADGGVTIMAKEGQDDVLWYESHSVEDMPEHLAYESIRYQGWLALLAVLHHLAGEERLGFRAEDEPPPPILR